LQGCKKYGIILAFDVPVTREAQELADKEGVRIMRADIIYHLFDQFTAYCKEVCDLPVLTSSKDVCETVQMPSCL
jgi:translation initiation factor 5B